jgi:TRAP-type mannitol/chloroaromatic compound transport system permease large subunit
MKGVAPEIPLQKIFKGTAPFIIGLVIAVAIVITFPMATWLPEIM